MATIMDGDCVTWSVWAMFIAKKGRGVISGGYVSGSVGNEKMGVLVN